MVSKEGKSGWWQRGTRELVEPVEIENSGTARPGGVTVRKVVAMAALVIHVRADAASLDHFDQRLTQWFSRNLLTGRRFA